MRKYASSIILSLSLFLGEIHTFWEKSAVKVENWIIARHVPMTVQWNIKYAVQEFVIIFYFLAFALYVRNKVNRTTVLAFLMLAVLDTLVYFYNFKTYGFGGIYIWFVIFWIWMYYGKAAANWIYFKFHPVKKKETLDR